MSEDDRVACERRLATLEADLRAMTDIVDALTEDHRKLVQHIVTAMMGAIALIGTSIYEAMKAGAL